MTKLTELGATRAGLEEADPPKRAKSGRGMAGKAQRELLTERRSEAEVMTLTPARARKPDGPQTEIIDPIGKFLRDVYNGVLTQPVPDRFLDLLQKLETGVPKEKEGSGIAQGGKKGQK